MSDKNTMQEKSPMLHVKDVSIAYGQNIVVQAASLQLEKGEIGCFLGPSGCGKTTLLRAIAGFEPLQQGEILLNNKVVSDSTVHFAPEKRNIGMVFQDFALFPHLTVADNIAFGMTHLKRIDQQQRTQQLLKMVSLDNYGSRYPHELSGGMRRRAEVARALISNPDILFMDEPFGALDFVTRLQMREEMVNVHAMFDMTILFITHDIDEALQLGDQIIVLSDRPSKIKRDIVLNFPHPRDLTKGELQEIRKEIYYQMGLHVAL